MSTVVVFDFDGVLSRLSEGYKRDAWNELFPDGSDLRPAFKAAEQEFGGGRGGSRFDILRSVYSQKGLTGEELENTIRKEEERFNSIVQRKVTEEGLRSEDKVLLEQLKSRGFRLYVNSATPKERLEQTIEKLGLGHIFTRKQILGQPNSKIENLKIVADKEKLGRRDTMLFVGDSINDYKAVEHFNGLKYREVICTFLGFENELNKGELFSEKFNVVRDLNEILTFFSEQAGEQLGEDMDSTKEKPGNDSDEWGFGKLWS